MNGNHWRGCKDRTIVTVPGRGAYCKTCGSSVASVQVAAIISPTKNEDPVSACDAPGPLDATKERRNG